jgi:hypothetical protein
MGIFVIISNHLLCDSEHTSFQRTYIVYTYSIKKQKILYVGYKNTLHIVEYIVDYFYLQIHIFSIYYAGSYFLGVGDFIP